MSHTTISEHHFKVHVAEVVGVNAAIILDSLNWWIDKNASNERHFHDEHYWTYNTVKALARSYPYMTEKAIRTAIKKLVDGGYILVGDYNKDRYSRPKWYTITEAGYELLFGGFCQKGQHVVPKRATRDSQKGNTQYIPFSSDTSLPSTISGEEVKKGSSKTPKKFVPPTVDEVQDYIDKKGFHFSAEEFIAYYEAGDWCKNNGEPVKYWKRCCLTWENTWKKSNSNGRQTTIDTSQFDVSKWNKPVYHAGGQ